MNNSIFDNVYKVIFTSGNYVKVLADEVQLDSKLEHIRFFNDRRVIARFNMNNIAGWVESKYMQDEEIQR